jgi:hypothetical protein
MAQIHGEPWKNEPPGTTSGALEALDAAAADGSNADEFLTVAWRHTPSVDNDSTQTLERYVSQIPSK